MHTWNSELKRSSLDICGATTCRAMVWLLAHCACPCGTDSGAICQPLTLIRLRQSIVSERVSMDGKETCRTRRVECTREA